MSEKSINEQLREQAEREGLLEPDDSGLELGGYEAAPKPSARGPVSFFMFASVGVIDALAIVAFLTLSPIVGVVLFIASSIVLSRWLSSRIRATTREGRRQ
jgi:Flp pilus assembly protein TadB